VLREFHSNDPVLDLASGETMGKGGRPAPRADPLAQTGHSGCFRGPHRRRGILGFEAWPQALWIHITDRGFCGVRCADRPR